jgi:hypothetical protein
VGREEKVDRVVDASLLFVPAPDNRCFARGRPRFNRCSIFSIWANASVCRAVCSGSAGRGNGWNASGSSGAIALGVGFVSLRPPFDRFLDLERERFGDLLLEGDFDLDFELPFRSFDFPLPFLFRREGEVADEADELELADASAPIVAGGRASQDNPRPRCAKRTCVRVAGNFLLSSSEIKKNLFT